MTKDSKNNKMMKKKPAFSQRILDRANQFINHYSYTDGNTSSPVLGHLYLDPAGSNSGNDAFWLLEDAVMGSNSQDGLLNLIRPNTKMLIDDLTLKSNTSKVKLSVSCYTDTNHANVGPGFLIQRSRDNGSTWDNVKTAYPHYGTDFLEVTRNLVTFASQHGNGYRGFGPALINIIDEFPNTLTPHYRVLITVLGNYRVYINREYGQDDTGYGTGTDASDNISILRTVSVFTAEEIIEL